MLMLDLECWIWNLAVQNSRRVRCCLKVKHTKKYLKAKKQILVIFTNLKKNTEKNCWIPSLTSAWYWSIWYHRTFRNNIKGQLLQFLSDDLFPDQLLKYLHPESEFCFKWGKYQIDKKSIIFSVLHTYSYNVASTCLYQIIRFQIDCWCSLIQNQNSGFTEASSCQTDQLTLADTQVLATLRDGMFQTRR